MSTLTTAVPSFESIGELQDALLSKENHQPIDLYPRDGNTQLSELEVRFANLARVERDELVLCASGMAAVTGAINTCINKDSVVAFAWQSYSQTDAYRSFLESIGIRIVRFDSGSKQNIENVFTRTRPTVVFSETVSNGIDTPVLDIDSLFNTCDELELNPKYVLDNTLPLSSALNTTNDIDPRRQVLIVESATKSYAFNSELAGVVYSKNEELLTKFKDKRRTDGFGPNIAAVEKLEHLLPDSRKTFDDRNIKIFKNSRALAIAAFAAQGDGRKFVVSHPAIPDHPNHDRLRDIPHGGSPVFYIHSTGSSDQFEIAEQLWNSKKVRDHAVLGQSFGFDETRILPNATCPVVRIAAGAETNVSALGCAIKRALEVK